LTPPELFWASAFLMTLLTRLVADYARVRLHFRGIHVHHFVWGILATFGAIAALYYDSRSALVYVGCWLAGTGVALISSEAKELVLQKWGR